MASYSFRPPTRATFGPQGGKSQKQNMDEFDAKRRGRWTPEGGGGVIQGSNTTPVGRKEIRLTGGLKRTPEGDAALQESMKDWTPPPATNPLPNEPEGMGQPTAATPMGPTSGAFDTAPQQMGGGDVLKPVGTVDTKTGENTMFNPNKYSPPARDEGSWGNRIDDLWNYGSQAMNNPSRYDADLVKQGAAAIEATVSKMREGGMRNLGEHFASRGLTGSSLEGMGVAELEGELGRYTNERMLGLAQDQARTWANDRNSAGMLGSNAAGMTGQRDRWMDDANFRDWNAGEGYKREDRRLDQSQTQYIGSLVDRFGPGVLQDLGIDPGGSGGSPQYNPNIDPNTLERTDIGSAHPPGPGPMIQPPAPGRSGSTPGREIPRTFDQTEGVPWRKPMGMDEMGFADKPRGFNDSDETEEEMMTRDRRWRL